MLEKFRTNSNITFFKKRAVVRNVYRAEKLEFVSVELSNPGRIRTHIVKIDVDASYPMLK